MKSPTQIALEITESWVRNPGMAGEKDLTAKIADAITSERMRAERLKVALEDIKAHTIEPFNRKGDNCSNSKWLNYCHDGASQALTAFTKTEDLQDEKEGV